VRGVTNVAFQPTAPRADGLTRPGTVIDPPASNGSPNGSTRHTRARSLGSPRRRGSSTGGPRKPASLLARWIVFACVPLAGAIAALVLGGAALTAVGALALAAVAALLGWWLGEDRRKALQREVDDRTNDLRRALSELEIAQAETVRRLSMAVEFRDEDTGAHIERIGRFSTLLAEQVGMSAEFCRRISYAAPLHDVGKVAIPDAILLKEGQLTPAERAVVETHTEEGYRLLRGSSSSILDMGAAIALSHHERWDGEGYPRGLSGEQIPIEGRIVAIADVFDALTSDRVYREAFSVEHAREMMRAESAKHFDPVLLAAFLEVLSSSGAAERTRGRRDRSALVASALDAYADAIRRGDAEAAETAIAAAIEDGLEPGALQAEVIAPAMGRIAELRAADDIDADAEQLASSITRRVLATMSRYMLARDSL
jgi:HD domain-containing protein/B12 binding protein